MSIEYALQVHLEMHVVARQLSNDMLSCGEEWLMLLEKDAQFAWFWVFDQVLKHSIRLLRFPDLFPNRRMAGEWRQTVTRLLPKLKEYYERLRKSPMMEAAYKEILTRREEEKINGHFYQEAFRNHLETPLRIALDPGLLPKLDMQTHGSKMQYFPRATWSLRWLWLERFATLRKAMNEVSF